MVPEEEKESVKEEEEDSLRSEVKEDAIEKSEVEEVYAEPLFGTVWKQVRDFGTQVSGLTLGKTRPNHIKLESSLAAKPAVPPSHGGTFHVSKNAVPLPAPSNCVCRRYRFYYKISICISTKVKFDNLSNVTFKSKGY